MGDVIRLAEYQANAAACDAVAREAVGNAMRDIDDMSLVASYVADWRASESVCRGIRERRPGYCEETAALWFAADLVEELVDATPEQIQVTAALLHREVMRRMGR